MYPLVEIGPLRLSSGGLLLLISIIVGDTPDNHVTHTIAAPTHVALKRTEQGADEALEIESEDRATLLRFPASAAIETVEDIS